MIEQLSREEKPRTIKPVTLQRFGITVHLYGVIHGITGGASKEYREFVNRSIAEAKGAHFCEKSMKLMYKGLDHDVCDWAQVPMRDAFMIGLHASLNPSCLLNIFSTVIRERTRSSSFFGQDDIYLAQDLISDPRSDLIPLFKRRELFGFPTSEHYFKLNQKRRKGQVKGKLFFASKDWLWLSNIERYVNIPFRSIHMIEYALYHARKHDLKEISLFVGETHNSDIASYLMNIEERRLPDFMTDEVERTKPKAQRIFDSKLIRFLNHLGFVSALTLSMSFPFILAIILMTM